MIKTLKITILLSLWTAVASAQSSITNAPLYIPSIPNVDSISLPSVVSNVLRKIYNIDLQQKLQTKAKGQNDSTVLRNAIPTNNNQLSNGANYKVNTDSVGLSGFRSIGSANKTRDSLGSLIATNTTDISSRYSSITVLSDSSGITFNKPNGQKDTFQVVIPSVTPTTPAGSPGFVQYNNSGSFGASNLFFYTSNQYLGIGTVVPSEVIHIVKDFATGTYMRIENLNGSAGLQTYAYNGTIASPTATTNGQFIGLWSMRGYGTSLGSAAKAYMGGQATQLWTGSAQGTKLVFATTPNGSTTTTIRQTIDQDGTVIIAGNQTVGGTLSLSGIGGSKQVLQQISTGTTVTSGALDSSFISGIHTQNYNDLRYWGVGGNTGTTSATQYIGTTDSAKFRIKTKGLDAIVIDSNQKTNMYGDLLFSATTFNIGTSSSSRPGSINAQTTFQQGNGQWNVTSGSSSQIGSMTSASVVSPLIKGGSGTTQTLTLQPTTGVGTTGADIIFQVGNNGGTEAMRILNNGNVGIGTSSPTYLLSLGSSGKGFSQYTAQSSNDGVKVVNTSTGATFGVQNLSTSGFSGIEYLGSDGSTKVFTGYNNGTPTGEFRFNNVATSGFITFKIASTDRLTIANSGNIGIGQTSPTAGLHIKAGTATASTAPLKFTTGTILTTAETGAMEYTDPLLYFTPTGTVRGVVNVSKSSRATAQTAANASVFTYTLPATDGSFKVSANVLVTTSSAENFSVTCSYTDEGNTARTQTVPFILLAGTVAGAINFANGAVPYEGAIFRIRCKASTAITIATTGTFTGATYNVEAGVTQIN